MSTSKVYTLYGVNVDTPVADSDLFIKGVSDFTLSPQIQEALQASDGQVDPSFVAIMSQSPKISFTSTMLASILAKNSSAFFINGLGISSDVDEAGAECWFQKLEEGGTRATGASHLKMSIAKGILVPRTLTARQGQPASMGLELLPTYDGTNNPIVMATAALSGTPGTAELFTLGPVKINGTALDGVQEVSFDPGIQLQVQASDGQVWPTYVAIMSRTPTLTITTTDVTALSTFGLTGAAQGATDSIVYLTKMSEGGARVANATEEHISLSLDAGMIYVQEIPAQHGQPAMARLTYKPTYDGTNAIVVVDTTAAIA